MPGDGTQATPEMVKQVKTLEEAELTPDGVRPLTESNGAGNSPAASDAGAKVEPEVQSTETAPQKPAQALEAPAPVLGSTPPAVEVISGPGRAADSPVKQAPAAEAAPAKAATEEKPSEQAEPTEAEQLNSLKTFGEQQAEEARRAAQATADRRASVVDRQLQDANEATKTLQNDIRELQGRDLTEEERATALAKYEQDDRSDSLDARQKELLDLQREVYVDSLLLEFGEGGVTREALEQIETPEAMELFCERHKSSSLEEQIKKGGTESAQPPAATATEKPSEKPAATTEKPAEQPKPQVPAGASAPSDVGGGGAPAEGKTFDSGQGDSAMRANLRSMDWSTVRLQ